VQVHVPNNMNAPRTLTKYSSYIPVDQILELKNDLLCELTRWHVINYTYHRFITVCCSHTYIRTRDLVPSDSLTASCWMHNAILLPTVRVCLFLGSFGEKFSTAYALSVQHDNQSQRWIPSDTERSGCGLF